MTRKAYKTDITDTQWQILEPLIPPAKTGGHPRSFAIASVCGATVEVVKRSEAGFKVLPRRWVVERTFGWLGRYRRLSKDYELLPEVSESMIYAAMVRLMLHRLAS